MRVSNKALKTDSRITAVLGPTNTGKTHFAIEQMVSFESGIIGFPLRLLARENYDRLVQLRGIQNVALVTGEEKIIPDGAKYYSCTVEAMPVEQNFDFLAVDEIQLCADPDRGHIFTDRLLNARGNVQTMFMGAETIRLLMGSLVPGIEFISKPRLSRLTYKGFKKLTRLPKRSAIVAFSMDDVYAIAELIRRQQGGTAVVLGALSPRTRNKQVEMYQNGEVDYLVATDAIGMGLNMDIHHVALASTRKYDGQVLRDLNDAELAQIAGRAGRYMRDGTFGVTGRLTYLDEDTVEAIENHTFDTLRALYWRNSILSFDSPKALLSSLDHGSGDPALIRGRPAEDYLALVNLMARDEVIVRAEGKAAVGLLWDVCQIPDFRQSLSETHQDLVADIYLTLMDKGVLDEAKIRTQMDQLDKMDGDVDTLMTRIAHVRTWTYITHKSEWLHNASVWRDKARAIEDRLSDALHEGLTKRFVDRRAAVLIRAMDAGADLLAGVRVNGDVVVEGHEVGHLEGFKFIPDEDASGPDYKAVMSAARSALKPEIKRRIQEMLNADAKQFKLSDDGKILYQSILNSPLPGDAVATVRKGTLLLHPDVDVIDSALLEGQDKNAVAEKLKDWLKAQITTVLEPLVPLLDEAGLEGSARGIAFQLHEALGILPRADIEDLITGLDDAGRAALRARKVRLGPVLVFLPALNKPAAIRLRALLWALWNGQSLPVAVPPDGVTSLSVMGKDVDAGYYRAIGYPVYGPRAVRVDMLDRLISAIYDSAKDGQFQAVHKMAEWLGCTIPDLYAVLEAMGHRKLSDPADEKKVEAPLAQSDEAAIASAIETPGEIAEGVPAEAVAAKPVEKPALATFQLRRGRAYAKKPVAKDPAERAPRPEKTAHAKPSRPAARPEHRGPKKKPFKEQKPSRDIMVSAPSKDCLEDSPFAALAALKSKGKD